ncbi:hypothetical protein PENSPDRAFT_662506 [Peniophora sp. CONT]|nr:hypothetical protein PENSPDRAFT_662506 [Peniophora sp. CONT]
MPSSIHTCNSVNNLRAQPIRQSAAHINLLPCIPGLRFIEQAHTSSIRVDEEEEEEEQSVAQREDGGKRAGGSGPSKPAASRVGEESARKQVQPQASVRVAGGDLVAPFTQTEESARERKSASNTSFSASTLERQYWLNTQRLPYLIKVVRDKKVRDGVEELTYVPAAQHLYGTRGRVSHAGKFLQEVGERCRGWSVSEAVVYALMDAYLEFESTSPLDATDECEGFAEFELNGQEASVRPKFLSVWASSTQKCSWVTAAAQGAEATDEWVALQPGDRCKGEQIVVAAGNGMDWGKRLRGGKKGACVLVHGLLLWADAMDSVRDGTSEEDWEMAAADVAQVLRVRAEQSRALAVDDAKSKEGEQSSAAGSAAAAKDVSQKTGGRERTKSKKLAYMEKDSNTSEGKKAVKRVDDKAVAKRKGGEETEKSKASSSKDGGAKRQKHRRATIYGGAVWDRKAPRSTIGREAGESPRVVLERDANSGVRLWEDAARAGVAERVKCTTNMRPGLYLKIISMSAPSHKVLLARRAVAEANLALAEAEDEDAQRVNVVPVASCVLTALGIDAAASEGAVQAAMAVDQPAGAPQEPVHMNVDADVQPAAEEGVDLLVQEEPAHMNVDADVQPAAEGGADLPAQEEVADSDAQPGTIGHGTVEGVALPSKEIESAHSSVKPVTLDEVAPPSNEANVASDVPGENDSSGPASPNAEQAVEAELGILAPTEAAVPEATAPSSPSSNPSSDTNLWAKIIDTPYTDIKIEGAPLQADADAVQDADQPSADSVIDISEDETAVLSSARSMRIAAKSSREGARRALEHDAEVEKEERPKTNLKRKMVEEDNYEASEEENDVDELGRDEDRGEEVVPNGGLAPKGGIFDYADVLMRFAAFVWAFGSLYGEQVQALMFSMANALVRLEMVKSFEAGEDLPALPPCALAWMTNRRAACIVHTPEYVRDKFNESHFELQMLYCLSVVRELKFEDAAGMHGRRGFVLLVHGLVQARAGNFLGDDWAPCVAEVARLLDALARKADGDYPREKSGEVVEVDTTSTVLAVLSVIDKDATDAVTSILARRVDELKVKAEAGDAEPAKRFKKAHTPSPSKAARKASPAKSPSKRPTQSAGAKKAQGDAVEGSSTGSSGKKASADLPRCSALATVLMLVSIELWEQERQYGLELGYCGSCAERDLFSSACMSPSRNAARGANTRLSGIIDCLGSVIGAHPDAYATGIW